MVSTQLLIETAINGLLLGGVYAIAALGLSLTFGIMDIVNLAHGHYLMIGGYVAVIMFAMFGLSPLVGMLIAIVVLFAVGLVVQRFLLNPVSDMGMEPPVLLTFGIALILQNLGLYALGGEAQATDIGFSGVRLTVGGILLPFPRVVTFVIAALLVLLTWAFLNLTDLGTAVRATAQNPTAATVMGIDTHRVFVVAMGVGAALAGASGALLSSLFPITPFVGWSYLLTAFAVVVLGGVGSIGGTLVGALFLGLSENLGALYFGGGARDIVTFAIFLAVMIARPSGLWGHAQEGE